MHAYVSLLNRKKYDKTDNIDNIDIMNQLSSFQPLYYLSVYKELTFIPFSNYFFGATE